jgi:hypothetical protein
VDLETRSISGIRKPYCVSIFDGKEIISFYLSDYKDEDEMLTAAVKFLMRYKYNGYKVYLHNFSNFDSIFLMRILSNLSNKMNPVIRKGRIINLRFEFSKGYVLYFRDSYLLLPSSLRSLAENFQVESKGIFPYKFVNNENIDLNYDGKLPPITDFDNITVEEYNKYKEIYTNKTWNLREETIKYCEQDVRSLYQVLDIFSKQIFELFRVDILRYPTISSLAFAIYRSNFLKEGFRIPLITGNLYYYLKKAYTGGSVDVYKPSGTNVYRYDVNSLYPYAMKNYNMPTDNPVYFEGDIFSIEPNAFGFFEVEVTAPKDINIPLLQLRYETKNGTKTIAPTGTWHGIYFSEELYNAQKHGYTFKVIRGYLFKPRKIFSEYVDALYDLKVQSQKGSPNYLISKLLLNSLYGRLGMNPEKESHIIIKNEDEHQYLTDSITIQDIIDLGNGKELISYVVSQNDLDINQSANVSVVVSAAVTASARIHMSQFKTDSKFNLFYTDTDSIDIDKPLDEKYIGEYIRTKTIRSKRTKFKNNMLRSETRFSL